MAVTRMGWQQESAPSVFRLNQSVQVLGDLIDQQPARAVMKVPDPGPGERPRPSTRWEGIAEQHQDLRGGMAGGPALPRVTRIDNCTVTAGSTCRSRRRC